MAKPYQHIEDEIDRLKYAESTANRVSNEKRQEAEIIMLCRMSLESALDKQRKEDERTPHE